MRSPTVAVTRGTTIFSEYLGSLMTPTEDQEPREEILAGEEEENAGSNSDSEKTTGTSPLTDDEAERAERAGGDVVEGDEEPVRANNEENEILHQQGKSLDSL